MININSFQLSGMIVKVSQEQAGGVTLWLEQAVCVNRERNIACNTVFPVFLPKNIATDADKKYLVGDEVIVENGLVYAKDDKIRIKVEDLSQVRKVNDVESLFLGNEKASEKFI